MPIQGGLVPIIGVVLLTITAQVEVKSGGVEAPASYVRLTLRLRPGGAS